MSNVFTSRSDWVKFYLSLWFIAFMGYWVNGFAQFTAEFRPATISYLLGFLIVLLGIYYLLYPLLKNTAFTAERSRLLPFVPAALLALHWLFMQLTLVFGTGGSLASFSFNILTDRFFVLFLFWGFALFLLASRSEAMEAVFADLKKTVRLFVAFAFLALVPLLLAQIIQAISALARVGGYSWSNYSGLAVLSDGGLWAGLLIGLVLLLIPLCGWSLLQKLLGRATPRLDRILRLSERWLAVLPLILIGLAALIQPETYWRPWFIITACFSLLSVLVNFLAESRHPVAVGIVKLAVSYFLYPYRYFRKIVACGKKEVEVTENENGAIDYFCYYVKGAICVAILALWCLLAIYPIQKYFGLSLLPAYLDLSYLLRSFPELLHPLQNFHELLYFPLVYFILVPIYAVIVTVFYEVVVILLQILVKINKFFTKVLAK